MTLTYFGHACFLVEYAELKFLFDPFIRPNPKAALINPETIEADYVFISHGHSDHLADAEEILRRTGASLISNYEITTWFQARGISKVHAMNLGGSRKFPFGAVKMVSAIHSSALPDGCYGGNPGGFVVQTAERTFYYSGDTALTLDMKLIGDQHDLDFAVLPIGDNFTMGAVDAALAAVYTGSGRVVGVHYDTFPEIEINHEAAHRAFDVMDVELLLPAIGESISL